MQDHGRARLLIAEAIGWRFCGTAIESEFTRTSRRIVGSRAKSQEEETKERHRSRYTNGADAYTDSVSQHPILPCFLPGLVWTHQYSRCDSARELAEDGSTREGNRCRIATPKRTPMFSEES